MEASKHLKNVACLWIEGDPRILLLLASVFQHLHLLSDRHRPRVPTVPFESDLVAITVIIESLPDQWSWTGNLGVLPIPFYSLG